MSDASPGDRPSFQPGDAGEGKVAAMVAWALFILSIPSAAMLAPVGLIVAYASRGSATGIPRLHIEAQIRLFWSTFVWTIVLSLLWFVSLLLSAVLIGIPFLFIFWGALFLLMVWFTVKSIIGVLQLVGDRAPD